MLFTGKEEPAAREEPPVKAQLVTIKMIYTKLFQCPLYCISSFIGIAVSLKSLLILFFLSVLHVSRPPASQCC